MGQQTMSTPMRTKQWALRLDLFEEGDVTKVHAVLRTDDNTLECRTTAHRNPHDPPVPEIGDEYAAGRALVELGHQLLHDGMTDAAANESARRRALAMTRHRCVRPLRPDHTRGLRLPRGRATNRDDQHRR